MPPDFKEFNWFFELPSVNNLIHIHYLNEKRPTGQINKFESYKNGWDYPHIQSVVVKAIFDALTIGFKEIYLFGVELSMHRDIFLSSNGKVVLRENHVYDEIEGNKEHIFWKDSSKQESFTMYEALSAYAKMFLGFDEMNEYSKYLGANIYNCSRITFVDSFRLLRWKQEINEKNQDKSKE
jgi:hypothetical protein